MHRVTRRINFKQQTSTIYKNRLLSEQNATTECMLCDEYNKRCNIIYYI